MRFELTVRCRTHAFQACSFGHSDTAPRKDQFLLSLFAGAFFPTSRWDGGKNGGEGGIRTHGTLSGTLVFETRPFDHSGTSPLIVISDFFDISDCRSSSSAVSPSNQRVDSCSPKDDRCADRPADSAPRRSALPEPPFRPRDRMDQLVLHPIGLHAHYDFLSRFSRKNALRTSPHCSAKTPPCQTTS